MRSFTVGGGTWGFREFGRWFQGGAGGGGGGWLLGWLLGGLVPVDLPLLRGVGGRGVCVLTCVFVVRAIPGCFIRPLRAPGALRTEEYAP